MRSRLLTVACVLLGGLAVGEAHIGGQAPLAEAPLRPVWAEITWPFLYDAWGAGRAFRCAPGACDSEISVYIRPKIGFCNCYTGVADDDEIDRVGDVNAIGEWYRALAPGKTVAIGDMAGRSRAFIVDVAQRPRQYAIGIAVSKKCDAVVATIVSQHPIEPRLEQAAMAHLNTEPVTRWAAASVGLQ